VRGHHRHRHRSRYGRRRLVRTIVIGVIALLVVDLAWASWLAFSGLRSARTSIEAGSDALARGELTLAASALAQAEGSAVKAASARSHPAVMLAAALPFIGDDVHAVTTMAEATELAASAGEALAAGLAVTDWNGEGLPGFRSGGRFDPTVIRQASSGLQAAARGLDEAVATADTIEVDGLVQPLGAEVSEARSRLRRQSSLVGAAADLSALLPPMLGEREPREYLLAFQNLSAPQGTGGYFGFYGVLRADRGEISLIELLPAKAVPPVPPVAVPDEVARRYGRFGVNRLLYASNYSPDVPTSSEVALEIVEAAGRGSYDGVVWTDTVWMADVLHSVGDVESAGWPEPITADNLVDVLNRQTFLIERPGRSDRIQGRIGLDLWRSLLERSVDPRAFAEAMSLGVGAGHFMVYSAEPDEEQALVDLGADGTFEAGENPLAVVWQDAVASRAGFFADKPVSTSVSLDADGAATVSTEATLRQDAPDGPPSPLLGDGAGDTPVGGWAANVEVYLPVDAEDVRVRATRPSVTDVGVALDRPVADCFLYAGPGGEMSCRVGYRVPGAATRIDDDWEYRVHVRPQAALRPSAAAIEVTLPEGATVTGTSPGVTVEGGVARWSGEPAEPTGVWVRYELA
jgi:hypothetical protein